MKKFNEKEQEVFEKMQSTLQEDMNSISIEMCHPLAQAVAYSKRVHVTGDSEESRQSRLGMALQCMILDRLVLLEKLSMGSKLACFAVSMGIKAESWCKTCSIEYEPDCIFVEQKDSSSMPYVFEAIVMVEVVWTNRPFLEQPSAIDPGHLFQKLKTYVMVDYSRPRIVQFRHATNWQPETFENSHMPSRIDGLDFEIDWLRVYSEAGVAITGSGVARGVPRFLWKLFHRNPQ